MTDPAQALYAGAAVREVKILVNKRGGGDACRLEAYGNWPGCGAGWPRPKLR
jgi:hypothetical protein